MTTVDVQIIDRPGSSPTAYDPQSMTVRTLSDAEHQQLLDYARAGHETAPLAPRIVRAWEGLAASFSAPPVQSRHDDAITQLVLANTYTCNMGCTYCYNEADSKPVKGSETSESMPMDIARKAMSETIAQLPPGAPLDLQFIGGEPLLHFDVVSEAVDYANEHREDHEVRISLYTNGTLLTPRIFEWIDRHRVSVVLSLDGPPVMNQHRVYLSGRPTAHVVLRNIRRLHESGSQTRMRVRCVTDGTVSMVDLHEYFLSLGFNEIHVQPMYDESGISSTRDSGMLDLLDWYVQKLSAGQILDIMPFSPWFQKLVARGGAVSSYLPCQAGVKAMTVAPTGKVYSCHHAIEEEDFQMGDFAEGGLPSSQTRSGFYSAVDDRSNCSRCWAKHVCGGECYHRAKIADAGQFGTLPSVCSERKALIGASLDAFSVLARSNPRALAELIRGNLTPITPQPEAFLKQDLLA